jgi:hypothetical protein
MRLTLLSLVMAGIAAAQGPSEPPPFLQLTRVPNGSKSGRNYQGARAAVDVIGMSAMTGVPETWYMEPHQTFASIEALDRALQTVAPPAPANQFGEAQDELLGAPRTMIAQYEPRFGYRPGETIRALPKSRYLRISIYRVRPGGDSAISTLTQARRGVYDNVNLDRPDVVYRVISGAPSGTFLVLAPMPSLASVDDAMQRLPSYSEPFSSVENAGVMDSIIGREHLIFRMDPRLSYVSADFAGDDASFWKPQK